MLSQFLLETKFFFSLNRPKAALKNMESFGVHRDLETYRALLDIMPKGKYNPKNAIQASFQHYIKQQDCAVEVLMQMSEHEVIPDMGG